MKNSKRDNQPYQIKGVDALFGADDIEDTPLSLPITQIVLPSQQPRRYFEPTAIQELAGSIKELGILQPLLVRPIKGGKYELVAGERRYRAAKLLNLEEVPVVVRELTDIESVQVALLENLQRQDLNAIEETEGILQLLAMRLNSTNDAVIALLGMAAHPERASVDNVIHSPQWYTVTEVFALIGKWNPESFRTNRLPLLNLPEDVMEALRAGQIEYTKARVIGRVKDEVFRRRLLEEAISLSLSLGEIKERIAKDNDKNKRQSALPEKSLKSSVDAAYAKLKKSKVWEDPKKRKKLEKLLVELETLVGE